ncbi:hypothetical protein T492DRAFT_1027141 [Pavlovales sp. CCMP2436]|nr:hypothetical protein T492DRAFT_1027141 [Pavlovales sp. CCMP2436]|mmetsp:Transcript_10568/g.26632  ORF Transcript_10568/g.26632 Transcript_10568/m.26632 type:complete len:207 (+) Transcript_10568:78-698(+)
MADHAEITTNIYIGALSQAYINEKCAPTMLPYQGELLVRIMELIDLQKELRLAPGDKRIPFYELELERMHWLVRAYLRTRMTKISTHAIAILGSDEQWPRLSEAELRYAKGYVKLIAQHATETVTARLKEAATQELSTDDLGQLLPHLKPETYVFCWVHEDVGEYDLGLAETADLRSGQIIVAKYSQIEPLLMKADGEDSARVSLI